MELSTYELEKVLKCVCGKTAEHEGNFMMQGHMVACECGLSTELYDTKLEAIYAWNSGRTYEL